MCLMILIDAFNYQISSGYTRPLLSQSWPQSALQSNYYCKGHEYRLKNATSRERERPIICKERSPAPSPLLPTHTILSAREEALLCSAIQKGLQRILTIEKEKRPHSRQAAEQDEARSPLAAELREGLNHKSIRHSSPT